MRVAVVGHVSGGVRPRQAGAGGRRDRPRRGVLGRGCRRRGLRLPSWRLAGGASLFTAARGRRAGAPRAQLAAAGVTVHAGRRPTAAARRLLRGRRGRTDDHRARRQAPPARRRRDAALGGDPPGGRGLLRLRRRGCADACSNGACSSPRRMSCRRCGPGGVDRRARRQRRGRRQRYHPATSSRRRTSSSRPRRARRLGPACGPYLAAAVPGSWRMPTAPVTTSPPGSPSLAEARPPSRWRSRRRRARRAHAPGPAWLPVSR